MLIRIICFSAKGFLSPSDNTNEDYLIPMRESNLRAIPIDQIVSRFRAYPTLSPSGQRSFPTPAPESARASVLLRPENGEALPA